MRKFMFLIFVLFVLVGCSSNSVDVVDSVDLKELIEDENVKDYYGESVNIKGYAHSVVVDDGETIIGHTGVQGNHVLVIFDEELDIEEDEYVQSVGELMIQEEYDEIFNAIVIEGADIEVVEKED